MTMTMKNETTIFLNETHLGDEATREDAEKMIEGLKVKGWNVQYGDGGPWSRVLELSEDREHFESDWDDIAMSL